MQREKSRCHKLQKDQKAGGPETLLQHLHKTAVHSAHDLWLAALRSVRSRFQLSCVTVSVESWQTCMSCLVFFSYILRFCHLTDFDILKVLFKQFLKCTLLLVCVHGHTSEHVWQHCEVSSLLPCSYASQGLSSGCQIEEQVPLSAEPSHCPWSFTLMCLLIFYFGVHWTSFVNIFFIRFEKIFFTTYTSPFM